MYSDNPDDQRSRRAEGDSSNRLKSREINFLFYWRALSKYKWPIVLFVALVTAAAFYLSHRATPVYSANATLLLESQRANIISIEDFVSTEQKSLDYYGTQFAILRSRALAERVVKELQRQQGLTTAQFEKLMAPTMAEQVLNGLPDPISDGMTKLLGSRSRGDVDISDSSTADRLREAELSAILDRFRESLRIVPVEKTKLVTIMYTSTDPDFAALVANTVASEYIQSVLEQRRELKNYASGWMDTRIQELKVKLDESEDALLNFKVENGLVDIQGGVTRLGEQELLIQNAALAEAQNELSTARDLQRKINQYQTSSPQLLQTLPFVQNDILVRSVNEEMVEARRDLVELSNRYGSKHPKIVDAEARMASLRSTLDGHIARIITTFENDYELLQQRVISLEADVATDKDGIQLIGQQKFVLEALEREVETNREQYNKLYDRITEIRTAEGLDEANAVLSEVAWRPSDSVGPNKSLVVGMAALFALFIAGFVALVREYLDDTVNSLDDVERRLGAKLLGALPMIDRGVKQNSKLPPITPADAEHTPENFLEAVNACRTSLLMSEDDKSKVILVTSSVPNEGKSTVALNLAYTFGQLERTLLIDCDLRRPSVAKALGLPKIAAGVTTLLESGSSDCIRQDVMGSFDCLTSGPIPEKPLESLSSREFSEMMDSLRTRYDRIIIDSAPLHVVSDALVLSKMADTVLYVVKPHDTAMKVIHNGLSRLTAAGASIAGICLSQLDISRLKSYGSLEFHGFGSARYGYGKYYRYGKRQRSQIAEAVSS